MTNMDRRTFLAAAGITALAHGRSVSTPSNSSSEPLQLTGNGEWTYAVVSGWGVLPAGTPRVPWALWGLVVIKASICHIISHLPMPIESSEPS